MNTPQPLLDLAQPLRRPSPWRWGLAGAWVGLLAVAWGLQHQQSRWAQQTLQWQQARAQRQAQAQPPRAPAEAPGQQAMLARMVAHQALSVRLQAATMALGPARAQALDWRLADGLWALQGGLTDTAQAQALLAELQAHSGQPWRLVRLSQRPTGPGGTQGVVNVPAPGHASVPAAPWQGVVQTALPPVSAERLAAQTAAPLTDPAAGTAPSGWSRP